MTLSLETLRSLPVPQFDLDRNLLSDLAESERQNKVYKQNSGAPQENVKHPIELLDRLNRLVLPEHADTLLNSHSNSALRMISPKKNST